MKGHGHISVMEHGSSSIFEELSFSYPLKLLSLRIDTDSRVALSYILGYGGGLVGGDNIQLNISVESNAGLMLLTQGSTKVFRRGSEIVPTTANSMSCRLAPNASLFLLPDPVTCFGEADYRQLQSFRLHPNSNLVLLDWFTSGRQSRGESWSFHRYGSINEIFVDKKKVALDILSLRETDNVSLTTRLAPYSCYATVFLHGPRLQTVISEITELSLKTQQMQHARPESLLWSFSGLEDGVSLLRVAAVETQMVRRWLHSSLTGLRELVGDTLYDLALE